jgi:hypothetical protein
MNISPQVQPVSTEHLLTCLDLAIDEAKLTRAIIKSKNIARDLEARNPVPQRLILLNREIELLAAKLDRVRS